jgi:hypothetical protein
MLLLSSEPLMAAANHGLLPRGHAASSPGRPVSWVPRPARLPVTAGQES